MLSTLMDDAAAGRVTSAGGTSNIFQSISDAVDALAITIYPEHDLSLSTTFADHAAASSKNLVRSTASFPSEEPLAVIVNSISLKQPVKISKCILEIVRGNT